MGGNALDQDKRARLGGKGWKVGSVEEFWELTPEETACVELKLALSQSVRENRRSRRLRLVEMAKLTNSSQPRVAKIETGEAAGSPDLLIRSLSDMRATTNELGRIIGGSSGGPPPRRVILIRQRRAAQAC